MIGQNVDFEFLIDRSKELEELVLILEVNVAVFITTEYCIVIFVIDTDPSSDGISRDLFCPV